MTAMRRPLALLLSAALLVVGFDLATYAANGDSLLLGSANKATKATKVKRTTPGPVLDLKAKAGSAPLKVNSPTKIAKLNADLLDGLDSAALTTSARTLKLAYTGPPTSTIAWKVELPVGSYVANWQAYLGLSTPTGDVTCGFQDAGVPDSDFYAGNQVDADSGFIPALSGSGLVAVAATSNLYFFCNAGGNMIKPFDLSLNQGVELTFQKLSSNPTTSVTGGTPAGRGVGVR